MKTDVEKAFKDFIVNSVEPIFFCDFQGQITLWNRGSRYLFGYSAEEIENLTIYSLIHKKQLDSFNLLFEVVKKGRSLTFETECITSKGDTLNVEMTSGLLNGAEEKYIYCIARDNCRIETERDKTKSMSIFSENSPDFIMEWDRFQGITYVNAAVRNFFKEIDEKQDVKKILPGNFQNYMRKLVGTDKALPAVEAKYKDHYFSYTFTPFKWDDNKVLIIGKDVTSRKLLEEEIDSAYKRTKGILSFIENVLKELQYIDLEEKLDLKPIANLYIRDATDQQTPYPTHVFIGLENDNNQLEGYILTRRHGHLDLASQKIKLNPRKWDKLLFESGKVIFSNWYDETVSIDDFQSRFPAEFQDSISEIRNFASYLITGEKKGVFIGFNYPKDVNQYDAETIKGLAIASGTIYSFQSQFKAREEAQFAAFTKLAELAEQRDRETGEHLKRISNYARILAEELGKNPKYKDIIDREFIRKIFRSSTLHDIGKVGIPDAILQKPGKLDDKEYEKMREHTIIGGKILEGPKFLEMASQIAYYHQEKYDGSGYPYGLKGEEIPLPARIVALADVYDAMTSKRVYKEAFSHERTKKLLTICSGGHFDPDVVDAFLAREQDFIRIKEMYKT